MAKRKLSIVVAVTVSQNVANIRITDYIGSDEQGADSNSIRAVVDAAINEGITQAIVYINSGGGSVLESTEIVNELNRFKQVTVHVGALAASAATYLTSKFYTIALPNSQFMIHRPRLYTGGDISEIEADLTRLRISTSDYIATYATKTGKTTTEIETLLSNGDVWMTAQEALTAGFIDEIEKVASLPAITAEDVAVLEACAAPVIPNLSNKNKNSKMEKMEIIAALGLAADATDEKIQAALKDAKQTADLYTAMQVTAKKHEKLRAEALVDAAILQKKISAEEKKVYAELAESNYEATKKALDAMTSIPQLSSQLKGQKRGESEAAAHKDWKLEDYMEKDPEALEKLYDENPEEIARLEAAYFGKKK